LEELLEKDLTISENLDRSYSPIPLGPIDKNFELLIEVYFIIIVSGTYPISQIL
jgi:hypothetical protein